jgi:hypothetical protein
MRRLTRRRFVERLGLGAGATLLGPLAGGLYGRAMGQQAPKKVVVLIAGNGLSSTFICPAEVAAQDPGQSKPLSTRSFTLPPAVANLAKYRDRLLIIDGLSNPQGPGGSHTASYAALSGVTSATGDNEHAPSPGAATLDQTIGAALGKVAPFRSVLVGVGYEKMVFAAGREQPEAVLSRPSQLYRCLFGIRVDPTGVSLRQKLLFDYFREDIRKLNAALAAPERVVGERVLSAVEDLDRRARAQAGLNCSQPAPLAANADTAATEDKLESLVALGTIALVCGMTNVLGISAGVGPTHGGFQTWNRAVASQGGAPVSDWAYIGHHGDVYAAAMPLVYNYFSGVLAGIADQLGKAALFDGTVMMLLSDNGDAHHASGRRWPVVVVGNAGGALKADGRFIRYPLSGNSGNRALVDVYSSVAHAVGVPLTVGMGGTAQPQGPLPEIM